MEKIETWQDLIRARSEKYPSDTNYTKETLALFGENPEKMELLPDTEKIKGKSGRMHECYVVMSPVEKGIIYHYLDKETLLCVERTEVASELNEAVKQLYLAAEKVLTLLPDYESMTREQKEFCEEVKNIYDLFDHLPANFKF